MFWLGPLLTYISLVISLILWTSIDKEIINGSGKNKDSWLITYKFLLSTQTHIYASSDRTTTINTEFSEKCLVNKFPVFSYNK